jgi:hypothetical protein
MNENCEGKLECSVKACPSATLLTTNPTRTDLGLNTLLCNGNPTTKLINRDGTANFQDS